MPKLLGPIFPEQRTRSTAVSRGTQYRCAAQLDSRSHLASTPLWHRSSRVQKTNPRMKGGMQLAGLSNETDVSPRARVKVGDRTHGATTVAVRPSASSLGGTSRRATATFVGVPCPRRGCGVAIAARPSTVDFARSTPGRIVSSHRISAARVRSMFYRLRAGRWDLCMNHFIQLSWKIRGLRGLYAPSPSREGSGAVSAGPGAH